MKEGNNIKLQLENLSKSKNGIHFTGAGEVISRRSGKVEVLSVFDFGCLGKVSENCFEFGGEDFRISNIANIIKNRIYYDFGRTYYSSSSEDRHCIPRPSRI